MKRKGFLIMLVLMLTFAAMGTVSASPNSNTVKPTIDPFGILEGSKNADKEVTDWFQTVVGKLAGYALMIAFIGVLILAVMMALPLGQRVREWIKDYGLRIIGSVVLIGMGLFVVKWIYSFFSIG
jgi:hypothetical protein